jgi:predicted ABC-type ATPase
VYPLTPLLWLCGPTGVGKSTTGWEIFSQLTRAAFVDADQLGLCYPASPDDPENHQVKARNLGVVWPALRAAGAGSVVLAGGIEVAEQIGLYAGQVPGAALTVCRLRAGHTTLRERFIRRGWMPHLVPDAIAAADDLDRLNFGDLCVDTDGLSVAEVARLVRAAGGQWPKLAAEPEPAPALPSVCHDPVPILLLCGPTAVGKSTVGYEVFTSVQAEAKAAYVDLAQIGFCRPAPADDPDHHRLKAANLAAMWPAFREAGARYLIVSGRVNDAAALRNYTKAFPASNLIVCRLHASPGTFTERVLRRGQGGGPAIPGDDLKFRTAAQLHPIAEQAARQAERLDLAQFGDWSVGTDGRTVQDIAQQIAAKTLTMIGGS